MSDGGLITCLLEMSFGGMSGMEVDIKHKSGAPIEILFAEEVGWVLETRRSDLDYVVKTFERFDAPIHHIGKSCGIGLRSKVLRNNNRTAYSVSENVKISVDDTDHDPN